MALIDSEYWKKQVFEKKNWKALNNLALKKFPDTNTADEAMFYVIEKLEEDDWKRVRKWEKESSFKTYLLTVAGNLLDDFSRSKFGRPRPPKEISARGHLYKEVYRWLCLKRMSAEEVIRFLAVQKKTDPAVIEEAIAVILAKVPDCGKHTDMPVSIDPENFDQKILADLSLHHLTPEDLQDALESASVLEAVGYLLAEDAEPSNNSEIKTLVMRFRSHMKFKPGECLFLKMIYQDGLKVNPAGRKLGWNADKAQGKHRRLLERIRKAIEKSGLDQDLIKDLLK